MRHDMLRCARSWMAILLSLSAGAACAGETIDFEGLVAAQEARAIADRREFHEHPELALREHETQERLVRLLEEIPGVELIEGDWGTGVVALLHGARAGRLIAWRADMDGLPIEEATGLPFASTTRDTSGGREVAVSHACGHDIHMSVALGAARVLSSLRERMRGSILFLFQPAEEIGAGAAAMIEAGVFEDGRLPACILALHDHPTLAVGQVGSCPGRASANVDGFHLVVKGRSGHGAYPHRSLDPVPVAAKIVLALSDIVSREIDVNHPAVISTGSIHGGTKGSIIPDEVVLDATVRTRDDETRLSIREKIDRTVRGIAASAGAPDPVLDYYFGTPAGYNDPALVAEVREVFRRILGPENDLVYPPGMGGEDFSRYGRIVPAFQFRLGIAPEGIQMTLHSSTFQPDERAIAIGIRVVSEVLWDRLQEE